MENLATTPISPPQYIDGTTVLSVLSWTLVNAAVEAALIAVGNEHASNDDGSAVASTSYVNQAPRTMTMAEDSRNKLLFSMPGFVGNYTMNNDTRRRNTLACKMVTSFVGNQMHKPPLPNILANILLFDVDTGRLQAILDGTDITTWRTAAASVVATRYLYFRRCYPNESTPEREHSIDVGIVGCGVQGAIHARAMCANFRVRTIRLWNRTTQKATDLAIALKREFPDVDVQVSQSAGAAVADVDVICVATFAKDALIQYADVQNKSALHINTVGAGQVHYGEVGQDIYDHATVYVDSMVSARNELKGLKANIVGEVGQVIVNGKYPTPKGYTIFQSMGMAAEDATVAQAVYDTLQGIRSSRL